MSVYNWCYVGALATSEQIAQECIGELDSVVAVGHADSFHRLANRFLASGSIFRADLQALNSSGSGLEYLAGIVVLQEPSLVSLVGRRVEFIHALINRFGKGHRVCMCPPYAFEHVREVARLELPNTDRSLNEFIVEEWQSRKLLDNVLALRVPTGDGGRLLSRRN